MAVPPSRLSTSAEPPPPLIHKMWIKRRFCFVYLSLTLLLGSKYTETTHWLLGLRPGYPVDNEEKRACHAIFL